jgi:hypothetical protein
MAEESKAEAPQEPVAQEAADDALLEQLEAASGTDDGDTPPAVAEEVRQALNTPDPGAGPDEAEEQPEATESDGKVEEEPKPEPGDRAAFERALTAAKRDGLQDALIEQMSEEDLVAYGEKAAKRQSDSDDAWRRLKELENRESPDEGGEESVAGVPADEPSNAANLSDQLEPLADLFGEDAASALAALQKAATAPFEQQIAQQQEAIQSLLQAHTLAQVDRSVERLGGRYPEMLTPNGKQQWIDKAAQLEAMPDYDTETALNDAARVIWGDGETDADRLRTESETSRKANGTLGMGRSNRPGKPRLSPEQREEQVLEDIEAGRIT